MLPAVYLAAWAPSLGVTPEVNWNFKLDNLKTFFMNLGAYELRVFDQPFWLPKLPLLVWFVWAGAVGLRKKHDAKPAPPPPQGLAFVAGLMALCSLLLPAAARIGLRQSGRRQLPTRAGRCASVRRLVARVPDAPVGGAAAAGGLVRRGARRQRHSGPAFRPRDGRIR